MRKNSLNYPVEIVNDAFGESPALADTLRQLSGSDGPRVLIVADQNVVHHSPDLGTGIGRYVRERNIALAGAPVVVVGGEKAKSDNAVSAMSILGAAASARISETDIVLAIGGGAVLDVAGWAVAQLKSRPRLVRMPTTPSAMFGAAFADTAGLDFDKVKDFLSVPSAPSAVVIDPKLAATVLDGVWRGGIGEAVRLALDADDAALAKLLAARIGDYCNRDSAALAEILAAVAALRQKKAFACGADSVACALEQLSDFKLPYGYAVPMALMIDLKYRVAKGEVAANRAEMLAKVLGDGGALEGMMHSQRLLSDAELLVKAIGDPALDAGAYAAAIVACR